MNCRKAQLLMIGRAVCESGTSAISLHSHRPCGEEEEVPYALTRITRSTKSSSPRHQLAREAAADVRQLLTAADDQAYWVGQRAVETWAERFVSGESGVAPNDPMFQSFNAIGKLAVLSQQPFVATGLPVDTAQLEGLRSNSSVNSPLSIQNCELPVLSEKVIQMDCRAAQLLIALHNLGDASLPRQLAEQACAGKTVFWQRDSGGSADFDGLDITHEPAEGLRTSRARLIRVFRRATALAACIALMVVTGAMIHHLCGTAHVPNGPTMAMVTGDMVCPVE